MKPRARRVTLAAAALGAAVVAVLVVVHRGAVRDHFRGWLFLLTQESMGVGRSHIFQGGKTVNVYPGRYEVMDFLSFIGDTTGAPVLIDPLDDLRIAFIEIASPLKMTAQVAVTILRTKGVDIIELRFPSGQYVVLPDERRTYDIDMVLRSRFGGG